MWQANTMLSRSDNFTHSKRNMDKKIKGQGCESRLWQEMALSQPLPRPLKLFIKLPKKGLVAAIFSLQRATAQTTLRVRILWIHSCEQGLALIARSDGTQAERRDQGAARV